MQLQKLVDPIVKLQSKAFKMVNRQTLNNAIYIRLCTEVTKPLGNNRDEIYFFVFVSVSFFMSPCSQNLPRYYLDDLSDVLRFKCYDFYFFIDWQGRTFSSMSSVIKYVSNELAKVKIETLLKINLEQKNFENKFSIDNISSTVDFKGIVLDLVWRIFQWSSFLREEDCSAIIIYSSNTAFWLQLK